MLALFVSRYYAWLFRQVFLSPSTCIVCLIPIFMFLYIYMCVCVLYIFLLNYAFHCHINILGLNEDWICECMMKLSKCFFYEYMMHVHCIYRFHNFFGMHSVLIFFIFAMPSCLILYYYYPQLVFLTCFWCVFVLLIDCFFFYCFLYENYVTWFHQVV